jgi:hypothetical protein
MCATGCFCSPLCFERGEIVLTYLNLIGYPINSLFDTTDINNVKSVHVIEQILFFGYL